MLLIHEKGMLLPHVAEYEVAHSSSVLLLFETPLGGFQQESETRPTIFKTITKKRPNLRWSCLPFSGFPSRRLSSLRIGIFSPPFCRLASGKDLGLAFRPKIRGLGRDPYDIHLNIAS